MHKQTDQCSLEKVFIFKSYHALKIFESPVCKSLKQFSHMVSWVGAGGGKSACSAPSCGKIFGLYFIPL